VGSCILDSALLGASPAAIKRHDTAKTAVKCVLTKGRSLLCWAGKTGYLTAMTQEQKGHAL